MASASRLGLLPAALLLALPAHALPYATTLNDLCPGTPNPCVVTGAWAVATGKTFDLGGSRLTLAPTARLIGDDGAGFEFVNADGIEVSPGALISAKGRGKDGGRVSFRSTTGSCTFFGRVQLDGLVANGEGGDGGWLLVDCGGGIMFGGKVDARGTAGPDFGGGTGGTVDLLGGAAGITLQKGSKFDVRGRGGPGGDVFLWTTGPCSIYNTTFLVSAGIRAGEGGEGGRVTASCVGINWLAGRVDGRGAVHRTGGGGYGGECVLDAGSGSLTIAQPVKIDVSVKGEDAGTTLLRAGGLCTLDGKIVASTTGVVSGRGGGRGRVEFNCDSVSLGRASAITARGLNGSSPNSGGPGGDVVLKAVTGGVTVEAGARVDVSGSGAPGGSLTVRSTGQCQLNALVKAGSNPRAGFRAAGGVVAATCDGDLRVGARISAGSPAGGGKVALEGCRVTVDQSGALDTSGQQGGTNAVVAHKDLNINGPVSAASLDALNAHGTNTLKYRDTVSILNTSLVKPATTPVQDGTLTACP